MTYGQTSSGKTYTLYGNEQEKGLIPRFLESAMSKLNEIESYENCQFSIKYSLFEIYKEKIFDLLSQNQTNENLILRENKNRIYVEGLKKKKSKCFNQIIEDIAQANLRRKVNETDMNDRSSRSHLIINFEFELQYLIDYDDEKQQTKLKKNFYEVKKKSKIIFIDLAGSEKQKNNSDQVFEEGCYINKSLSVLNHVIKNLSKKNKSKQFSHFRDSKLSYYLKDIFLGNSHFCIIGNILPYKTYLNDTINTLNFVSLAQNIQTNPRINIQTKNNTKMMQNQIKALLEQINILQKGQQQCNHEQEFDDLQQKIFTLKNTFKKINKVINLDKEIIENLKKIESMLDNSQRDYDQNVSEIVNKCHTQCDSLLSLLKNSFKIENLKSLNFLKQMWEKINQFSDLFKQEKKINKNSQKKFDRILQTNQSKLYQTFQVQGFASQKKKVPQISLDYLSLSNFDNKTFQLKKNKTFYSNLEIDQLGNQQDQNITKTLDIESIGNEDDDLEDLRNLLQQKNTVIRDLQLTLQRKNNEIFLLKNNLEDFSTSNNNIIKAEKESQATQQIKNVEKNKLLYEKNMQKALKRINNLERQLRNGETQNKTTTYQQ